MATKDKEVSQKPPATSEELLTLRQEIDRLKTELAEKVPESDLDIIERELELVGKIDPYSESRQYKIIAEVPGDDVCPAGRVLRFKNFTLRGRKGMKGWQWVRWGDPIAKELEKYVANPPVKDMGQIDDIVRRNDDGLAWLPKDMAEARQLKVELESAKARGALSGNQKEKLGGAKAFGEGLKREEHAGSLGGRTEDYVGTDNARHNMYKRLESTEKNG